jgi:hypothetical protein
VSSGTLFVRFPDGEVRYGIYHGTCDIANDRLFATSDEAWEARVTGAHNWPLDSPEPAVTEPVSIYTNYGGGFYWEGRASREMLTDGHQPYGDEWDGSGRTHMTDGAPEWLAPTEVSS